MLIYYNRTFKYICDENFDGNSAIVACMQLTNDENAKATFKTGQNCPQDLGFWISDLNCVGTETSLNNCPHKSWGDNNCYPN